MTAADTTNVASEVRSPGLLQIAWQISKHGSLPFFVNEWRRQGDLARLQIGNYKLLFAVHPEYVRDVYATRRENFEKLLKAEGIL